MCVCVLCVYVCGCVYKHMNAFPSTSSSYLLFEFVLARLCHLCVFRICKCLAPVFTELLITDTLVRSATLAHFLYKTLRIVK